MTVCLPGRLFTFRVKMSMIGVKAFHKTGTEASMMKKNGSPAYTVAFCSLMAALGAVLMLTGGLIPVMTYCSPLLAGVLLIPVLREHGRKWAWLTWIVTAALSLILSADKEAAFFYLFLGYYPILKPLFDRVRPKPLALISKLLFFALAIGAMYALIAFVFRLDVGLEELEELGRYAGILFFVLLTGAMLIYDYALRNLALLYEYRLRPKLVK